ncbi:alpha/beta hydrolase [Streptomyces sp. NPDC006283]|uniref:alpha/beta hydrolase n=1 Tax=Streptomyces sp. NPDC006283 TaxID=3156741 RepID=UPI0033B588BE
MRAVRDTARISKRKLRGTLAVLSVCGLLLTACSSLHPQQPPAATGPARAGAVGGADSTATVSPELLPYYRQTLHWKPCAAVPSFQCATLTVPLDYARPQAGDIRLAAIRKKATAAGAARMGSLLLNPGGPGASAVETLLVTADRYSPAMRAAYDLVALDPRGVGASTPVDCDTDTPVTISGVSRPGKSTTAGQAAIKDEDAAFKQVAAECARHAGRLLPHVGTPDTARDMDIMRALLGDDRLNFLGFSYGTYLGATYAELFPSRVGRMVLDGAVDPALDGYRRFLEPAHTHQVAWESFAADCAARPACPVGHSVKEAGRALDSLRATLNRTPLRQGKDVTVTGEDLMNAVVVALMAPAWDPLRAALREVQAGDTTTLQQLLAEVMDADPGDQAFSAISCRSSTLGAGLTSAQAEAALPEFLRASPQFGDLLVKLLMMCTHWPVPATQPSHPITAPGAAPMLVVGTTRDPATPYSWAKALARQLDSGHLLTYDGDGHTAYLRDSTCINTAVDQYLIHGRLPATGKVCT